MSDPPKPRARGSTARARGVQPGNQPVPVPPSIASVAAAAAAASSAQPTPMTAAAPPRVLSRGRGTKALPKTAPQPSVGQLTQAVETVSLVSGVSGDGSSSGNGNGGNGNGGNGNGGSGSGSTQSRGAVRQRLLELVTRPPKLTAKQGSYGTRIQLKANYVGFLSKTDWTLYQYRVDFEPDEERTMVRKALLKPLKTSIGPYIFDGTVMFTTSRLHPEPLELAVTRNDGTPVRVIIKKTTDCVWGDHSYLQVLNILMRKALASLDLQLVGRDYYDPLAKVTVRDFNFEIWPGYLTSIRQHEHDILMNVEVSSKVMRLETAYDLLDQSRQRTRGGANWKEIFEAGLLGTTVITRYNNKTYQVDDVDYSMTPMSTFDLKGEQTTFVQYYQQKYNLKITHTDQPMLVSKPKARDVRGGRDQLILLIPELSCLTGITDEMRSNFSLMKAMGEHTRINPANRIKRLESGFMQRLINSPVAKGELTEWNIKLDPKLITVPGRLMEPEKIFMGRNAIIQLDSMADFTRQLKGKTMIHATAITSWVCIYPAKLYQDIEKFAMALSNSAKRLNFDIPEPHWEELADDRAASYANAIERSYNKYQPILILCALMNNKADKYEAIKKKCYVDRAIPSQCVLAKNLASRNVDSICTKIAIQINCKLGGTPWGASFPFKSPVMLVGFDVTHSKAKGRSVGALVASMNNGFSRYFSAISLHTGGEELSNNIAIQMAKAVIKFQQYNKDVPTRIIFYRDGVGDGNIHHVLNVEVKRINEELKPFYPNGDLKLTYIIVTKKINTRLFMNYENPAPGTVVDDVITQPERFDFFLVSQHVNQGTVSPTHYNIIYDSGNNSPDMLQRLTFKLCHLYFNWSGTVRVPAPVQYAHKLAFLVGQSIRTTPNSGLEDLLYFL